MSLGLISTSDSVLTILCRYGQIRQASYALLHQRNGQRSSRAARPSRLDRGATTAHHRSVNGRNDSTRTCNEPFPHPNLHVSGPQLTLTSKAYLIPDRIASLSLLSTAAAIENTTTFLENLNTRIRMFIPKSLDQSVTDAARSLFSAEWLALPDDTIIPTSSTPNVILPPSGKYGIFATNYERFAAQELSKRLDTKG